MYNILSTSLSGMGSTQHKIDLISQNINNVNTKGYKKVDFEFQNLVNQTLKRDSYPTNSEDAIVGTGVRVGTEYRDLTQGNLKETGVLSNIAIDGDGFFRVRTIDGQVAYTRDGEFTIDSSGKIVDTLGNVLDIEFNNGLSYENVDFSEGFLVTQNGKIEIADRIIGWISLYDTVSPNDLYSIGDSLFVPKEGVNVLKLENAKMHQGHLEMSNVILSDEMVHLISMQRAFQLNSKGVQVADQMWSLVNQL